MKQKAKLVATLMAMCMVVSFAVIGILAVKTLNMSVGGNISFFAEGVSFTIGEGAFYQTDKITPYAGITVQSGKLQGFAMNTNTKLADVETQIASWANLDLKLDNQGDAVLKFNIKNDMSDKELYVLFEVTLGTNTNNNMNIVCQTSQLIAPTDNKNIEITFDILDTSINAGLTGFKIDLVISEPVEVDPTTGAVTNQTNSKYSNALYNIDTTAGTATISKSNANVSGELVLMDKVYVAGQEYVVTEIAEGAFENCGGLTGDLIIPNTVTKIGIAAFNNCSGFDGRLVLPNSLEEIEAKAFGGCLNFVGELRFGENLIKIGYSVFVSSNFTGALFIPKSVTSIGVATFAGCDGFTSVVVEDGNDIYESKGNCIIYKSTKKLLQAFACSDITQLQDILDMEQYAFSRVGANLGDVVFSPNIEVIRYRLFFHSLGIKSITIGENIKAIENGAFESASSLEYVVMESSTPPTLGESVFYGIDDYKIYVPAGSVDTYKTADGWSNYADRIFAIV